MEKQFFYIYREVFMELLQTQILEYLNEQKRNVTIEELSELFGREYQNDDILTAVVMLEKQGKIFRNKKNQFQVWNNGIGRIYGTIHITSKGAGILKEEDGKVTFIHRDFLNGAINGDKAIVRDLKMVKDRQEGKVEKIIDRSQHNVVCEVTSFGGVRKLKPLIENEDLKIKVDQQELKKYYEGDLLLLNIDTERQDEYFIGDIVKRLCHKDDPKSDIITIAATHGFDFDFPDDVKEEVKLIQQDISGEDISDREDLRDKMIFTIDGEDTKDIDDAISIEKMNNGHYKLGVHIADVTNYVQENSALDWEAKTRGTSVYLVDRVIPMLPHILSNGMCSLNAGVDRLALSCLMTIDAKGEVVGHDIVESVIRVDRRMSYTSVKKILEDKDEAEIKEYEELVPMFEMMKELASLLREKRRKRGSIDFDFPETKIILDKEGHPIDIKPYDRNVATKIIEDFMLIANETVAQHFYWMEIPFVYRTHDNPDSEKVEKLATFIRNFGYTIKSKQDEIHPKELQKLLVKIEDTPEEALISRLTLRSMKQAKYTIDCSGHFGLACQYYCHFTSPIRRYPDLQIHRIIKEQLRGKMNEKRIEHYNDILPEVAKHSSEMERRADEAERETDKLKKVEYMEERIGNIYEGVISSITSWGVYVELPNTIEGMIHVSMLSGDYFYYDEESYEMVGQATDKRYKLGERIKIRVNATDKIARTVDFVIPEEWEMEEQNMGV